jgi:hypothetical protein
MGLQYPPEWKFDGVGIEISSPALRDFEKLIQQIVSGTDDPHDIFETFKTAFGNPNPSSNASWAESDMHRTLGESTNNAVTFVDSFWQALEILRKQGIPTPSASKINAILSDHQIPLLVEPPKLQMRGGDAVFSANRRTEARPHSDQSVFKKHEQIGRGGFGVVHRVTRATSIGEFEFAMKILNPSSFIENKQRCLERFKREVRILQDLQHRCIVPYIEAGVDEDGRPYILMPLIKGNDLREATSGMDPSDVVALFREVLVGVEYAHSREVLHRDLKPSNVLVRDSDGQPIILDFGCGYLMDDADEKMLTTSLVGSGPYVPPEVHRDPSRRSKLQDVYACGITLYEILARELPDVGDYRSIEESCPGIEGVDALILDAIKPEKSRLASIGNFITRLDKLILPS